MLAAPVPLPVVGKARGCRRKRRLPTIYPGERDSRGWLVSGGTR
jgi:hypothetical protein